ncbi:MAG: four helix bundle protein [Crocinitomicaceae bacterium]|nr:four helix bundle protein [Crocinitomicaceae bacterium]
MWSDKQKKIMQLKIDARHYSRELIRDVFQTTDHFPKNDPEQLAAHLRKKALSASSLLSHGTTKTNFEEQNQDFLMVMQELREILKFVTIAYHLNLCNQQQKLLIRQSITNVINSLDDIVLLQQKD